MIRLPTPPRRVRAAGVPVATPTRDAQATYRLLASLTAIAFALMALYASVRLAAMIASEGYTFVDGTMAAALLAAELFLCVHGIGYFGSVMKAAKHEAERPAALFVPPATVPVAVLVAAFNESSDVLEDTLASVRAMDYPHTHIYLVDDSTREECRRGAERLARTYGATFVHRTNRAGYKAGAINDLIPLLSEPYIAVLDADQRPIESWLKDVVPLLEADAKLAFVQVPQIYVNDTGLPVAQAAKYQQAIFFEYICEGKSHANAVFCCGSNVVLRRAALLSIEERVDGRRHFFDETSVTEDFATSVRLHAGGWTTAYVNRPYVLGMGPETLPAYFTQQMRWAMGTLAVGLQVVGQLLRNPRRLSPDQWFEYLLSGTYYFVGFANFIFMLAPMLFMAFDVRPMRANAEIYLLVFVPYVAFTMNLVFYGMRLRGYPARGIWLASALSFATFWTYMKAGMVALVGLKRAFGVTPKGVGGSIPLRHIIPEFVMFIGNLATALAGLVYILLDGLSTAMAVNTFWAGYHAVLLGVLFFYLNKPVTIAERQRIFAVAA